MGEEQRRAAGAWIHQFRVTGSPPRECYDYACWFSLSTKLGGTVSAAERMLQRMHAARGLPVIRPHESGGTLLLRAVQISYDQGRLLASRP